MKNTLILSCYDPVHEADVKTNKICYYNQEHGIPFNEIGIMLDENDLLYSILQDTLKNKEVTLLSFDKERSAENKILFIPGLKTENYTKEKWRVVTHLLKKDAPITILSFPRFDIQGKERIVIGASFL